MDRTGFLTDEQELSIVATLASYQPEGERGEKDILPYTFGRSILVFEPAVNDFSAGRFDDAVVSSGIVGIARDRVGGNWPRFGGLGDTIVDGDEETDSPVFADNLPDYDYLLDGGRLIVFPRPVEGTDSSESPFRIIRLPFSDGLRAVFDPPSPPPEVPVANTPPEAADDTATTRAGAPLVVDVLANDTDADGDPLVVSDLGPPANGSAALNDDGTVTYTPDEGFVGTDSFTYTVDDGQGGTAEATVTVTVEPAPIVDTPPEPAPETPPVANTPPEAADDTATTQAGVAVMIDVLANDSDADADPLQITGLGEPANGSAALNDDGTVTYTPDDGFAGDDSFTYIVDDGNGGTAEATVTVTVEPALETPVVNTPPVAADDTATTLAGTAVTIGVLDNDSDADGDPLQVTALTDPANGTVALNDDDEVVYTPNLGFIGEDSFGYTIDDGEGGTAEATVTVTVDPEPGAVVGTDGPDVLVGQDPVQNTVYGLGGDDVISIAESSASATIFGGAGVDTVVFDDAFDAFAVSFADEAVIVTAAADRDPIGVRTLYEVERLQFTDGTFEVAGDGLVPVDTPPDDTEIVDTPGGTGTSLADMVPQGLTSPAVPQARASGDLVGFGFQGGGGAAQWVTIGQAFVQGDLRPGQNLALDLGSTRLPVQLDVKATHGDGSVRHAMLTFELPSGSGNRDGLLQVDPLVLASNPGTITAQNVLNNAGYDLQLKLDFADGGTTTIDAKQALAEALAQGTVKTWMQGPQASEFIVEASINEHLDAEFAIRAYADGQVRTDVIVRNETTYTPGIKTYTYDAAIIQNGAASVSHADVGHYRNANWHEVVWNEGEPEVHVIRDMAYLADTGAVPTYDLSIGVQPQSIASDLNNLQNADTGPLGSALIAKNMAMAGGRADIGPLTRWATNYVMSQDEGAWKVMMAQADAAGSIPWQYRDETTGDPVSLDDRPTLWFDTRGNRNPDAPAEGWPTDRATQIDNWRVDVAHQPSLSFLPYVLTGDYYHLENLQMQANHVMASYSPGYRGFDEGIVNQGQARSVAWGLRALGDAAWITPDTEANKSYFVEKYQTNLDYHVAAHVNGDTSAFQARALGYGDATGELGGIWYINTNGHVLPWMHDFIATTLASATARGFEQANPLSGHLGQFIAGRFINGGNGFPPDYGAPYWLSAQDPETRRIFDTWQEIWDATFGPGGAREGASETLADRTGLQAYPIIARAGLASIISATGDLDAVEAYAFVLQNTSNPGNSSSNPTFGSITPRFADGSYLQYADIIVGTDNSETITGSDRNQLIIGAGGNNMLTGGAGIDWIIGGPGNDTLRGGPGNDYLIGGAGNDRLIAGLGSDQMKGGSGANTFVIDAGAPADRNVIHDFDVLQDRLEIAGSLAQSRQALLDGLSVQEGGVTLNLANDTTIFLKGLVAEDLTAAEIVVS